MKVTYYFRKQNYGVTQFYLAKKDARDSFARLTGRKTIKLDEMRELTSFSGMQFEEVFQDSKEVETI